MLIHVLADAASGPVPWWLGSLVTPVAVLVALARGYLRLPQEYQVLQQALKAAEGSANSALNALSAERDKVDALNAAMREQVVPAMVGMTAASVEATRELRRRRVDGAGPGRGKAS